MGNLYPYQQQGVDLALKAPGLRWIFGDETGLGKTAQAITAAKALGAQRILTICPAAVRYNWRDEFRKWASPDLDVGVVFAGSRKQLSKAKKAELESARNAMVQVWSYSLVHRCETQRFDTILLDEVHLLQSPGSQWSKAVRKIIRENPGAAVFGLTATLMPNRPIDSWNVVDTLCPARFGEMGGSQKPNFKFCQRYTNAEHNGYGWKYDGIAEDTAEELRFRLASMSSRATKKEWGHLLPPFTVRVIQGEAAVAEEATGWARDALWEASHVAILTHRRESARNIAAQIQNTATFSQVPTICITGDEPADKRRELLAQLKAQPSGILVATMHSVGLGIDLTWCTRALFAELYWRPETIVQAIGRFSRLSGSAPSLVDLLVIPGTASEKIAYVLKEKIAAIGSVSNASQSESLLGDALGPKDEQWLLDSLTMAILAGGPGDEFDGFDLGVDDDE